MTGGLRAP